MDKNRDNHIEGSDDGVEWNWTGWERVKAILSF